MYQGVLSLHVGASHSITAFQDIIYLSTTTQTAQKCNFIIKGAGMPGIIHESEFVPTLYNTLTCELTVYCIVCRKNWNTEG